MSNAIIALPDKSFYSYHSLILNFNFRLTWDDGHVTVTWVPSHVGGMEISEGKGVKEYGTLCK